MNIELDKHQEIALKKPALALWLKAAITHKLERDPAYDFKSFSLEYGWSKQPLSETEVNEIPRFLLKEDEVTVRQILDNKEAFDRIIDEDLEDAYDYEFLPSMKNGGVKMRSLLLKYICHHMITGERAAQVADVLNAVKIYGNHTVCIADYLSAKGRY